ncbi:MAG TPA: protein kinase [Gemmatimonadaceae bacterium]|nr:protein kinase [Gemmatimonadaceae bacterium]
MADFHYRLEEEIGRGGMGVVYRAVDTRLGRVVAIKKLPTDATADPERNRRFVQEARSASALNHPHIVTIHGIDEHDGETFIAMEFVDGTPLDGLLKGGPMPVATALEYAIQIAGALEAAHAAGLVHRDIKPANIMITRDGRAKVLDFGLAKLIEASPTDATRTVHGTRAGTILGTAEYMSPEQAQGQPVDGRSDIFSFGAVVYEMLGGRRPFAGTSDIDVITAILRDQPSRLRTVRTEIPATLEAIVDRCLEKDPAARYPDAGAVRGALSEVRATLGWPADAAWRRPAVVAPLALLLLAVAAFGVWQTVEARRGKWAREVAVPEIERLQVTERSLDALPLVEQTRRYAPEEIARVLQSWSRFSLTTEPEGAHVEIQNYLDVDGPWVAAGPSPVRDFLLPFGHYRLRIVKAGFVPLEVSSASFGGPAIRLTPVHAALPGMVAVPGGTYSVGITRDVPLPDFWIDHHEVTNEAFKTFVDAGGYRDPRFWKEPFRTGGQAQTFEDAMSRFRDSTGRPGPSTWELESFPDGQAGYPVTGISWYEAAAYAEFVGKSLPTIFHWYAAAGADNVFSDVLLLSNFDGKGTVRAGERRGLGPWGTFDMGGNAKEWCSNAAEGGLRYILGGGWNEPSYRFRESEARDPWERRSTFGVRLVKSAGASTRAAEPVAQIYGDPKTLTPVADKEFEIFKRFYSYDRTPLNARVDAVDDGSPHWRRETVSFDAAYGGERVPAYLFLPKNAKPPYQTVVLFPNAYARAASSSAYLDYLTFEFIIRSGRAVLYPVYKETFERGGAKPVPFPSGVRDMNVAWAKDFFRAVDYLETRPDVDKAKLAYYSLSMGAYFGPIPISLEPRIKAAVLAAGGLRFGSPPEITPTNFSPRVKVPVLVIFGRDDFSTPPDAQQRYFDLLGTPPSTGSSCSSKEATCRTTCERCSAKRSTGTTSTLARFGEMLRPPAR